MVFFFQAEDGIRDDLVTGVQTCALPIYTRRFDWRRPAHQGYHNFRRSECDIAHTSNRVPGPSAGFEAGSDVGSWPNSAVADIRRARKLSEDKLPSTAMVHNG